MDRSVCSLCSYGGTNRFQFASDLRGLGVEIFQLALCSVLVGLECIGYGFYLGNEGPYRDASNDIVDAVDLGDCRGKAEERFAMEMGICHGDFNRFGHLLFHCRRQSNRVYSRWHIASPWTLAFGSGGGVSFLLWIYAG